jgi:hypothetical protein
MVSFTYVGFRTVFFLPSRATCPVHLISRVAVTVTEFREKLSILVSSHMGENLPMNNIVQCINDRIHTRE